MEPGFSEIVNREYVPVRVDTERRPDVNERYNVGGWPTIAFLTPGGGLLWGTASADPVQLRQVVDQLHSGYRLQRERLEEEIRKRDEKVEQAQKTAYPQPSRLTPEIFRKSVRGILLTFDASFGGFGREPKFPMPASLQVLLWALQETGGPDFREVLTKTLDAIAERGLYDAVEGGFFRYCETESWGRPHTEKLCEENAGLIRAFLDAWSLTGESRYRARAVQSVEWVWKTLWEPGSALFYGSQGSDDEHYALPRERRGASRPLDRTQFTASAAQMCSTFLRASAVLDRPDLEAAALRCLDEIVRIGLDPHRGVAHFFDPQPQGYGLARAQAYLARALVDAYESTGRTTYLDSAEALLAYARKELWYSEQGGWLDRPPGNREWGELARPRKNIQENSVAAEAAIRLSYLRGKEDLLEFARRILLSFPDFQDDYGHYTAEYSIACDWMTRPVFRIELSSAADPMRQAALALFVPRRVIRYEAGSSPGVRVFRGASLLGVVHSPEDLAAMI